MTRMRSSLVAMALARADGFGDVGDDLGPRPARATASATSAAGRARGDGGVVQMTTS